MLRAGHRIQMAGEEDTGTAWRVPACPEVVSTISLREELRLKAQRL
jgi:hypothetical protein